MAAYSFKPAGLHGAGVWGAIAGGSRSGKTLTALRLARGIVGPEGKIAAVDTEAKRMSYYAARPSEPESHGTQIVNGQPSWRYHFDVLDLKSPFSPGAFADIAEAAEQGGYGALVIDSFSLEWTGIGGVLDAQEKALKGLGGEAKNADKAWAIAKRPHKIMRDRMMQCSIPILFCVRTNEVAPHLCCPAMKSRKVSGWKAEQDPRFLYEWTFAITMHPLMPGKPCYEMHAPTGEPAWKMPNFLKHLFPEGQDITEAAGASIQAWRNSDLATEDAGVPRTLREVMRDRLASVGSDDEIAALECHDLVQRAFRDAPEDVKRDLSDLFAKARERVASEHKSAAAYVGASGPEHTGGTTAV